MRKFIDTIPTDFEGSDVEVEGYNTIVELHNTQHETQRAALETFQTIAMAVIEMVSNENARRADIDNRRLSLEEEKFNFEREKRRQDLENARSRERVAIEDVPVVSEKTLASKSGTSAKSKVKSGSRKG